MTQRRTPAGDPGDASTAAPMLDPGPDPGTAEAMLPGAPDTGTTGWMAGLLRPLRARRRLVSDTGWVIAQYGYVQLVRLLLNIVLARLLAPAIFGVMALITTLRTGVELLTDIGIGQSIVVARRGEEPGFVSTAWTVQVGRGALLFAIGLAAAWPLGHWYAQPEIAPVFAAMSTLFLIGGLTPPVRQLMQRRRLMRQAAVFEILVATAGALANVGFALVMPTIWGLAWATIVGALFTLAASFLVLPLPSLRLRIDPEHARAITSFGKWIFVSSIVYFFATNFDRLYLPTRMSFTLFGVYGIARTIADAATQLVQRLATMIVFPAVAQMGDAAPARLGSVRALRRWATLAMAVGFGGLIAASDLFIAFAYDDRYAAATLLAPLLLVGAWFSVQAATAEAVLLGLSRPDHIAGGNFVKFAWIVALLPLSLPHGGLLAALAVIAFSDLPRYFWLTIHQYRAGLGFWRQDAATLVVLLAVALATRVFLWEVGVIPALVTPAQAAAILALR